MNDELDRELVRRLSLLERRVDDLVEPEFPRWVTWTPTVTQGVAVTVTRTFARYTVGVDRVSVEVRLVVNGNGTVGQPIVIAGIPAAIRPTNTGANEHAVGVGVVLDANVAFYVGALVVVAANDLRIIAHGLTSWVGATPSFGLAGGADFIGFCGTWER